MEKKEDTEGDVEQRAKARDVGKEQEGEEEAMERDKVMDEDREDVEEQDLEKVKVMKED